VGVPRDPHFPRLYLKIAAVEVVLTRTGRITWVLGSAKPSSAVIRRPAGLTSRGPGWPLGDCRIGLGDAQLNEA
jgi:hypothetical protein